MTKIKNILVNQGDTKAIRAGVLSMNEKRIRAEQKELKPLSKKKFVEIVELRKRYTKQIDQLCYNSDGNDT